MPASAPGRLEILFAAEFLLPPVGGAERFALEWLGALARRHGVRAVWLDEPGGAWSAPDGVEARPVPAPGSDGAYWRVKRERREAVGAGVHDALDERPADVVVGALHAAPAAIAAARGSDAATVLMLHSYEALCKYAFDRGSRCEPRSRCRRCPRAGALDPAEREELFAAREAHEMSLAHADRLVAPSRAVAGACEAWCGRRPAVVPDVTAAGPVLDASPQGHVLLASARWKDHKGLGLLEPLAAALAPRPVVVTAGGLDPARRRRREAAAHVDVRQNAPIAELLAEARALLVPSQWPEPFGRVAFEGLAAGVPVLASAVGGLPEYVPAGQLVSPPDSVSAWVSALEALEDPERWSEARREGIATARAVVEPPPVDRLEAVLVDAVGG
jgi:glycosyltransferase involved in cell wall biosynthesis